MPQDIQTVDIPGVGPIDFPTSMSDADISKAAKRLHDEAAFKSGGGSVGLASEAAATNKEPETPDTSFLHTLSQNPGLQGAAHPQGVGDLLSLAIPSGAVEALRPVSRVAGAAAEGYRGAKPGILNRLRGGIAGATEHIADVGNRDAGVRAVNASPRTQLAVEAPGVSAADRARSGGPPPAAAPAAVPNPNDLPEYLKQQMMEQHQPTGAASSRYYRAPEVNPSGSARQGMPPYQAPPPSTPAAEVPRRMPPLVEKVSPRVMPPLVPETQVPRQMPPLAEGASKTPRDAGAIAPSPAPQPNVMGPLAERTSNVPREMPPLASHAPTPTASSPRLAGKAPTLEDELTRMMESLREPTDSRITNLPPEATTAGEGATRQSGKFKRSESLGQSGGYTSGRPSITPTRADEMLGKLGGRDLTSPSVPEAASTPAARPMASHTAPEVTAIDPKEVAPGEWQSLRNHYGSKRLSQLTGIPQDEIQRLAPKKPGLPTEVEQRIQDTINKNRYRTE